MIQILSRLLLSLISIPMLLICLTACSDKGDDPEYIQLSDKEIYENITSSILDKNGNVGFSQSPNSPDTYLCAVMNEVQSKEICESFSNAKDWNGIDRKTISLGEYGSYTICKSEVEGVFHEIDFNLTDVSPFTLQIATIGYCQAENGGSACQNNLMYICEKCGRTYLYSHPNKCYSCGGKSFKYRAIRMGDGIK